MTAFLGALAARFGKWAAFNLLEDEIKKVREQFVAASQGDIVVRFEAVAKSIINEQLQPELAKLYEEIWKTKEQMAKAVAEALKAGAEAAAKEAVDNYIKQQKGGMQ